MESKPREEAMKTMKGKSEKNIVRWRSDVSLPPVPNTNFASFFLNIIANHGDSKALIDARTGDYYSYNAISAKVPRVSAKLRAAGVGTGDRVLLMCSNHIDLPITMLGIMHVPATCVPVSVSNITPGDVIHAIRTSGASWAVVEEGRVGIMDQVTPLLPPNTIRKIWTVAKKQQQQQFEDLLKEEEEEKEERREIDGIDYSKLVALMPFSSGTTGLPKGVMLSHQSFSTIIMQSRCIVESLGPAQVDGASVMSRILLIIPLYHIYAINFFVTTLIAGNQLILLDKFSPRAFLHSIERYKITYTPIVPHIVNYLLHSPLIKEYDISSLFAIGCGSAPLPMSDAEGIIEKIGVGVGNGYGLTETCAPICANNPRLGFKPGSVGRPLPYVDVKVVSVGGGSRDGLAPGEEGEIWVTGPGVMLGYCPSPDSPSPPPGRPLGLGEGGWVCTGDLGYCDEEGFIFLTDRLKDVMKVKGMQVSPREIEGVLREVEGVGEVAVVGVPSKRLGEAPRAYVVPAPGVNAPSPVALMDHVKGRLPPHKHLAGGLEVVESLPKNAMGKILKRDLRKKYISKTENAGKLSKL